MAKWTVPKAFSASSMFGQMRAPLFVPIPNSPMIRAGRVVADRLDDLGDALALEADERALLERHRRRGRACRR